ncbi:FtsZ/tubulin family protein [Puniceicoccus vermicola]|uniref:Tubulin/FtsZ GTPase domain-containing protein n=1 Tax=Puniceicoccus vermicola TaxID=388746 RepID=A0A7X1E6C3_9BACT|nr:hypothetical protein [Puniceicoccus vermicola]MBC2603981.1 hypothetical protein [Puniceicoccus vermicola]
MSEESNSAKKSTVCLVGAGGGAMRVLERFRTEMVGDIDLMGFDTDARELDRYPEISSMRLGRSLLRGLGCGGDDEMGRLAAESDRAQISQALSGYDLVIVVGCLGRGFASGALPGITALAGESGTPTVALVSTPFEFEGKRPATIARKALSEVRQGADCVVELPNDLLFQEAEESDRADQLFDSSDEWMFRAVSALIGPIFRPGIMSADLATFRNALKGDESRMHFSTCRVRVEEGVEAVAKAIYNCPFRSAGMERVKADRLIVSVGSGGGLSVSGFSELTQAVTQLFDSRESAIVGFWEDPSLGDQIEVTVFARTDLSAASRPRLPERVTVHQSKLDQKRPRRGKERVQTEFDTLLEHNERGLFGRMDVEAYNGVDLDKPTFLRRGIKIPMPKS